MCINSNAVINNNYGRLQNFILHFRIAMGTRKNFLDIYKQFGHAPSKGFASPAVEDCCAERDCLVFYVLLTAHPCIIM